MHENPICRLRQDLHALESATGLGFPYEKIHVQASCVFAAGCFAAALFAWIGHGVSSYWRLPAEFLLAAVPVTLFAWLRNLPLPGTPARARSVTGFTVPTLVVAIGSVALAAWLTRIDAVQAPYGGVIVASIFAAYMVGSASRDRRLKDWYLSALGTMVVALFIASTSLPLDLVVAPSLGCGAIVQALVWRFELIELGRW